ncbi:MAG: element excision factor XisH family protein [Chloroflexota bacterium]
MAQYDLHHNVVKHALIKDGWTITDDPFIIEFKGLRLYADLGAERTIAAEKANQKIVVEIKTFGGFSPVTELERAVGQYNIYRTFLKRVNPDRDLYLAIAQGIFQDFFQQAAIREVIADQRISLLVFSPEAEEVVQWIS